jgi:MFS family permease
MTSTTTQPLTRRDIPVDRDLRILALGSFANRFGAGAVLTTSALYFTRQIGFGATEVALAMSVSAVVGIVVQVPAGHLGDTRGPRRVLTAFMVGAAVFSEPPVLATTPWMLALVFVLNAVLTGFAAWNSTRLPDIALHARAVGEPQLAVIRDWPYVVITVITGLFSLHFFVMEPPHERQGSTKASPASGSASSRSVRHRSSPTSASTSARPAGWSSRSSWSSSHSCRCPRPAGRWPPGAATASRRTRAERGL